MIDKLLAEGYGWGAPLPALCVAAHYARVEAVALLLARGADPNAADARAASALHHCAVASKTGKGKGAKETKESKAANETKESKGAKETNESKGAKETNESKAAKESKGAKETKESKGAKETKESKGAKGTNESKGAKESKESKGANTRGGGSKVGSKVGSKEDKVAASIARLLLEAGADPSVRSLDGETPFELAARLGRMETHHLMATAAEVRAAADAVAAGEGERGWMSRWVGGRQESRADSLRATLAEAGAAGLSESYLAHAKQMLGVATAQLATAGEGHPVEGGFVSKIPAGGSWVSWVGGFFSSGGGGGSLGGGSLHGGSLGGGSGRSSGAEMMPIPEAEIVGGTGEP